MRLWTVHEPRSPASALERADRSVFVKDGFSWPGLFVSLPWLLTRRLWLGTLIYLALSVAAGLAGALLPLSEDAGMGLALLASLYVGFEGNDLRRRKLARQGFVQAGTVLAKTPAEAERIFFAARGTPEVEAAPAFAPSAPVNRDAGGDVLGLFPRPEGRR